MDGRDPPQATFAVTEQGLNLLFSRTNLNEVALLHFAMTQSDGIDDLLKTRLLFGLLLRKGTLRLIKEDGIIIAPVPEVSMTVPLLVGAVSFLDDIVKISKIAPNLQYLCRLKGQRKGRRADQLIQFILHQLTSLPAEDTLLGHGFRLKSYSSVMNKLFYRGKSLTDLFAATVDNESELETLISQLDDKGGVMMGEPEDVNGNGDLTYRYVRILRVVLQESPPSPFNFPVYYEVIKTNHFTPASHEQYEWVSNLKNGTQSQLGMTGFTVELTDPGSHERSQEGSLAEGIDEEMTHLVCVQFFCVLLFHSHPLPLPSPGSRLLLVHEVSLWR
jgi:hypothetical protein